MSSQNKFMQPRSVIGLIIIVLAIIIFFDNLGIHIFSTILRNWPLALIIIGIAMLVGPYKKEQSTGPYILITIGLLFFLGQFRMFHYHWNALIFPIILLAVGVYILRPYITHPQSNGIPENRVEIFSILGGGEFNTRSDNLKGGHAICILGGADIDIREADMEGETMVITCLAFMGGVQIKVPLHWQVNVQAVPLLGGVSNKTSCLAEKLQMPKKSLSITGLAIMGGIEVLN